MTSVRERISGALYGLRVGRPNGNGKQARGVARPINLWPDYRNAQPLWSMTDLTSFIDYGFNLNAVIYAACIYRADAVNTAQFRAMRGDADKSEALKPSDPLARLLARPNPYQSAHEFHALNSVFYALAGQSFVWFGRNRRGDVPEEMYTLRPDWVTIVPARENGRQVIGYIYAPEGTARADGYVLLPEDVMHAKRPNPGDPLMGAGYGFSPLAPTAQSANVDNDVTKFLKVFFQSGAMFQNVVTFDVAMDSEVISQVRERLREIYGGAENWNEWAVMDQGAKVTRISPTFDEMGFDSIDARNEARILMALGVPPILVGARLGLERSTYSNYEEARRAFWEDRLLPELRLFENEYNYFLSEGDRFVALDLSDVPALRRDVPALTTAALNLFRMGVPARQAFTTVGLEVAEYEGDEERYLNVTGGNTLQPATVTPEADEATEVVTGEAPEDEEREEPEPAPKSRKSYDPADMAVKVDRVAVQWEERFGDQAVKLFREEQRAISALLTEMQQDAYRRKATPNWRYLMQQIADYYAEQGFHRRPETWREAFVPLIDGVMQDAGREWSAALGVQWTVRSLAGEAWFQSYTLKFANPITANSNQAIHELLEIGFSEGWSVPQTQKALGMLFNQWMEGDLNPTDWEFTTARLPAYRRELIARTESIRFANAGALNLGKEWGAKKKFWIGTNDNRIRDTHIAARDTYTEKSAIPIDDSFIVGGQQMNAPGDPAVPIEDYNCRCALGLLMED